MQGHSEVLGDEVVQGLVDLRGDVGVQEVPKVPGNGAGHAPLPMLIRQQSPISPTTTRSVARISSKVRSLFGLHDEPSGMVS